MAEDEIDPLAEATDAIVSGASEPPALVERAKAVKAVQDTIRARQGAYVRWWQGKPIGDDNRIVADDLRRFCRGGMSAYDDNERVHLLLTGRQEVWLRIMDHVQLSFDDLYERYTGATNGE